jgi:hypothetical protein
MQICQVGLDTKIRDCDFAVVMLRSRLFDCGVWAIANLCKSYALINTTSRSSRRNLVNHLFCSGNDDFIEESMVLFP